MVIVHRQAFNRQTQPGVDNVHVTTPRQVALVGAPPRTRAGCGCNRVYC